MNLYFIIKTTISLNEFPWTLSNLKFQIESFSEKAFARVKDVITEWGQLRNEERYNDVTRPTDSVPLYVRYITMLSTVNLYSVSDVRMSEY